MEGGKGGGDGGWHVLHPARHHFPCHPPCRQPCPLPLLPWTQVLHHRQLQVVIRNPNRRLDGCFRCNCRKTEERDLPPWERTPSTPVLGMAAVVARFLYTLPIHLLRVSCYSVPFSFIHSLPNLISGICLLIQDAEKDSGVTTFL